LNKDFNKGMPRLSASLEPTENGPHSIDHAIELITAVQGDVSEAEVKGLFGPLPRSEPKRSKDWSRIKTIRNRLFIMGYLEKDTGRGNLDASLAEAIRAFQAEAGLEVDGWVGEQETWPALRELVSFETPIHLPKWFAGDKALPALRRAVALRLFVLGLLPKRPLSPAEDIQDGLRAFAHIWQVLFGDAPRTKPSLDPAWLELLFDLDGITRRLSKVRGKLSREAMNLSHGFMLNAAKIELWLMGYRVRPGGYDLVQKRPIKAKVSGELTATDIWKRSATVSQYYKVKRNFLFYKALHSFWIDHGHDDTKADKMSVGFLQNFQSFFRIVDEGIRTAAALDVAQRQIDLEVLILERKEQIPSIWQNVKRFGARIWDGIRRVWGWFRLMLTRFKQKVLEIGTNLSRIIYDFALGSFTVVSNIFHSLTTMAQWVAKPTLPGSDGKNVVFCRDVDNDVYVLVGRNADGGQVVACSEHLERAGQMFAFGCQVIGAFVSMLVNAFTIGWTAYFGLVLALIRLRRMKYKIQGLTEAYQQVFST
jgi:hypothetical protein